MLPLSSSFSSTLPMSNLEYLASRTPRATFSKSQNTAMLLMVGFAMRSSYTRVATSAAATNISVPATRRMARWAGSFAKKCRARAASSA